MITVTVHQLVVGWFTLVIGLGALALWQGYRARRRGDYRRRIWMPVTVNLIAMIAMLANFCGILWIS